MSTDLYTKIYNFLVNAEEKHITAGSVIYQGIEENPQISQIELRTIIERAVSFANNNNNRGSSRYTTLLEIFPEFEISYKTVCSLRDIGAVKTREEDTITPDKIRKNIIELKGKLKKNTTSLYQHLYSDINNITISELSWKDPLASQVISDDSRLVQQLPGHLRHTFMKPVRQMVPTALPLIVQRKCDEFVSTFIENRVFDLPQKLLHDGMWKETDIELSYTAKRILDTLSDSWNNPVFGSEFVESLNEGTYVTNVIVPAVRATLKDLPLGKSTFITSSERQSSASANRRGVGRSGKRPDVMFVMKHGGKYYELLYIECSRLFCTTKKEIDDGVKLWRECNDGLYWTRKSCKPDKDEFGIVGIQVAGNKLLLNVLIRDMSDIHHYYHLYETDIPVQQSNPSIVSEFVKSLLILRNIMIVNMTLLYNASLPRSARHIEDSTTIKSPLNRIIILEAENTKVKATLTITRSNARSKIDLLEQRIIILETEITNLKKENAEIPELRKKFAEVEAENAKVKAESLREVKTRERIEKTMLELDGCLYHKSLSMK
ncbi:hypothetical protein Glove_423g95 [Diversispora epigaea]|uniref:Uncharacterized protein n=1 Tax=Diversispora epigaea TaxID=1348612 RepID=A0A397H0B8_9GLOM|nr:hypothetical protein Glove_423g95 [Diversispora epigaea]